MTAPRLLLASSFCFAIVSCANQNADDYDVADPYAAPDYGPADGGAPLQPVAPVNPVYDTPPAYEDTAAVPTPSPSPTVTPPSAPAGAAATVHTVVKGDTLWGLSQKYKVSVDAIKQANGMTKDTVVLGTRVQIPAR